MTFTTFSLSIFDSIEFNFSIVFFSKSDFLFRMLKILSYLDAWIADILDNILDSKHSNNSFIKFIETVLA